MRFLNRLTKIKIYNPFKGDTPFIIHVGAILIFTWTAIGMGMLIAEFPEVILKLLSLGLLYPVYKAVRYIFTGKQ